MHRFSRETNKSAECKPDSDGHMRLSGQVIDLLLPEVRETVQQKGVSGKWT